MPSENDTLSGETNTFESCCVELIVFQSANENWFDAPSTHCSAALSWRGRAVSAAGFVWPGSVDPTQAPSETSAADVRHPITDKRRCMLPP